MRISRVAEAGDLPVTLRHQFFPGVHLLADQGKLVDRVSALGGNGLDLTVQKGDFLLKPGFLCFLGLGVLGEGLRRPCRKDEDDAQE